MENEQASSLPALDFIDGDTLIGDEEDFLLAVEGILSDKQSTPVYINDLPDALVDGKLVLKEGDYIVIEKWNTTAERTRWLGTSLYKIKRLDPLGESGDMLLHDEDLSQSALANWKTGPKHGWRFKQSIPGLNLHKRSKPEFEEKQAELSERNLRGLARLKELSEKAGPLPVSMIAVGSLPKTGRGGRPRGIPNKPNPVKDAAKAAKLASQQKRRDDRKARKAQKEVLAAAKKAKKVKANHDTT